MLRPRTPAVGLFLLCTVMPAQVTAYHDVSSATHQAQFNTLTGQGYRLVSLSVAGGLSAPRYSAVWEQVGGPGWVSAHDMSATTYSATRTSWISQGFRPKLLTVAGAGSNRVYAAVFVADNVDWDDATGLTATGFENECALQRDAGRIPVSVDVYGDALLHHYAAVFEANSAGVVWGYDLDATPTDFTTTRTAHAEGGERLACLGMSETQRYVSVWYDQRVGNEGVRHDYTSTGWQTTFNSWTSSGHYPRIIASGGSGSSLRFAGSFAQYRSPQPRLLTTTGTSRPEFAAIESYVRGKVVDVGRRAGAIAIAKDGRLVFARAFTWAESGYPITQPTSVFRIGSCAKVLTSIAVHQADEQGVLSMTTSPQPVLGLSYPSGSQLPNVDLSHILDYTSGVLRNYDPETIAPWVNPSSPAFPVTLAQGTAWIGAQPMVFTPPGSKYGYSNGAFLLAGETLRVRTGQSFMGYLQSDVLGPLGITRMRIAPSQYGQLASDDVRHQLAELQLLPSELYTDRRRRSAQYAEDLTFKQCSGGLASSVVDYVRFLAGIFDLQSQDTIVLNSSTRASILDRRTHEKYDAPGEYAQVCLASMAWNQRPNGGFAYTKGGWLPTNATADVCWRDDGVSWAVFFNGPQSGVSDSYLNDLIDQVASWPNVDEFPNYGLPAYPQSPRLESLSPASLPNLTNSYFTLTGDRLDTVTRIQMGFQSITSQSPTAWATGWFRIMSPTTIRLYPPQNLPVSTQFVQALNATGGSNTLNAGITATSSLLIGAPTEVAANQNWTCYVSRGTTSGLSALSLALLCVSFSNAPSVAPGVVTLGIGSQFGDLVLVGPEPFSGTTGLARFDLPSWPSGTLWVQGIAVDLSLATPFPLPSTSNWRPVTRL